MNSTRCVFQPSPGSSAPATMCSSKPCRRTIMARCSRPSCASCTAKKQTKPKPRGKPNDATTNRREARRRPAHGRNGDGGGARRGGRGPPAAEEPLKIGFGMAETGPLAGTGKSALLAMTIWAEDINAKGGLLGRQVKLVHYDDQSSPANVPALYAKLIDIDKVDLIISGYATPMIAATIP